MGTTRILCMVLLAVGTATAYPQYGGGGQQQEEEVPLVPVQQQQQAVPVPPAETLTQEQQGALEEFWWQNQGVFNAESPGGTVVVVQEQSSQAEVPTADTAPFIPIPSPDCAALHGCVPWQNCVDGLFTQTISVRTPPKAPEEYTQTLCGQIGNICCRIPDTLLALQEHGQAQGTGPYGPGGIGGEIIEVVNTGDEIIEVVNTGEGLVVVEEQINTGADPYTDGGEITGTVSAGIGGAVPVVDHTGVAVGGETVVQVEGQTAGAGPYGSGDPAGGAIIEAVSTGVDGTIPVGPGEVHGTIPVGPGEVQVGGDGPYDGSGVETVAVPHAAGDGTVVVADQTGGATVTVVEGTNVGGIPVQTYELIDTGCTPYTHDCVPFFQCIDGEINDSGIGLLDVRVKQTSDCVKPGYPDESGVCCRIPGATPPPPVETCPGNSVCVPQDLCTTGGTANTFTSGILNAVLHPTCYVYYNSETDFETGVCCEPPSCPSNQNCVTAGTCAAQGSATYDPSVVQPCYQPGESLLGECCDPPTPAPLSACEATHECVDPYLCDNSGYIITDGEGIFNVRTPHKRCYIDPVTYEAGVCCRHRPVEICPADQTCITKEECGIAVGDAEHTFTSCFFPGSTDTGVCCTPPPPPDKLVEVCPGSSVCTPESLCLDDILVDADTEEYLPYGSSSNWAQCSIIGDASTKGVCCLAPQPIEDFYSAATQCGVRNYGIDQRLGQQAPALEKNEAQFGEFPWQAIIFFTNFTYKCGASIINEKWLLTGAHCVHGYQYGDFRIRLGEWQVNTYDEPIPYLDVDIASLTIHPDFNPKNLHNDIALLELAVPIEPKYHINSVCLPNYGQTPDPGTYCVSTGWGKDAFDGNYQHILKKVNVPAVEHGTCQEQLRKTRLGKYFILDDSFMCAGGEENLDACVGDGGGPLVCQDPETNRYYIAGITAWGISCGVKDVPGVYADVTVFRPWIDEIINPLVEQQQQQQQGPSSGYGRK